MRPTSSNALRPIGREEYERRQRHLAGVYSPQRFSDLQFPPADYHEFLESQRGAPQLNVHLQHELFALMAEYEERGWVVNGHPLYDSQRAYVTWIAGVLTKGKESPSSISVEGPAGIGKTLVLGMCMQALVRMQMNESLQENVAFVTAKPYHMTSKTVGLTVALRRMLATPPHQADIKLVRSLWRDLRKMFPALVAAHLPQKVWEALFTNRAIDFSETRERVRALLGGAIKEKGGEQFLAAAATLVSGRGTTVTGVNDPKRPDILEFPVEDAKEGLAETWLGDAAVGVPEKYPVYASHDWHALSSMDRQDAARARILLTPSSIFTGRSSRERMADVLRHVGVVLIDEVRRCKPPDFQDAVTLSGGQAPLLIGLSSDNYDKKWDRVSPRHALGEAIEAKMLPAVRADVFPSAEQTHYPASTRRAHEQLIEQHFTSLPALDAPPWLMDTLMVVQSQLTRRMAKDLLAGYTRRGIEADVRCLDTKASDDRAAGKSQKAILEAWFIHLRAKDRKTTVPRIMVIPVGMATDALDLPNIQNLTIGTTVNSDQLHRLMGRALHSNRHLTEGPDAIPLVRQQQFSNSHLGATLLSALEDGRRFNIAEGFEWFRGQVLLPTDRSEREQRLLTRRGMQPVTVPGVGRRVPGTPPAIVTGDGGEMLVKPPQKRKKRPSRPPFEYGPKHAQSPGNGGHEPRKFDFAEIMVHNFLARSGDERYMKHYPSLVIVAKEAIKRGEDWGSKVQAKLRELKARENQFFAGMEHGSRAHRPIVHAPSR